MGVMVNWYDWDRRNNHQNGYDEHDMYVDCYDYVDISDNCANDGLLAYKSIQIVVMT